MGNCCGKYRSSYVKRIDEIFEEDDLKQEEILERYRLKRGEKLIFGWKSNFYGLKERDYDGFNFEPNKEDNYYNKDVLVTGLTVYSSCVYINLNIPISRYKNYRNGVKDIEIAKIVYYYNKKIDYSMLELLNYFTKTSKKIQINVKFEYKQHKRGIYKRYISHEICRQKELIY